MGLWVPDTFILATIDVKYSKYRLGYFILSLSIHISRCKSDDVSHERDS